MKSLTLSPELTLHWCESGISLEINKLFGLNEYGVVELADPRVHLDEEQTEELIDWLNRGQEVNEPIPPGS